MSPGQDMRRYAGEQIGNLLGKLVFELHGSAKSRDADGIHDLRVAIRRFLASLRVFRPLLPDGRARKIRKRLKVVMNQAAMVRDLDIALELLDRARVARNSPLRRKLIQERNQAEGALAETVREWNASDFSAKWRSALRINQS